MHSHGASNINYSTVIFIFSLMFTVFHNQSPQLMKQKKTFSVFAQPDDMRRQLSKISANPRRIELNWVKNFPFVHNLKKKTTEKSNEQMLFSPARKGANESTNPHKSYPYRTFSHDITAATFVSQNNRTAPCWAPNQSCGNLISSIVNALNSFVPNTFA